MDKRDILIRLLGEETVARMADRAGDGLDRFGKSLDATEKDAHDLDRQIADVDESLKRLAVAFARTSDAADRVDISKAMRRQQAELRKLTKAKDLLPDFNEGREQGVRYGARFSEGLAQGLARAGGPLSAALSAVFGELPPPAQAAIGAGVVGAVASVGPLIGGAVAGAIVGGIGAGGVVGGIAIAARHQEVQASAKRTGQVFAETMQRAGVSFVPATLDALGMVREGIGDMEGDLERAFSSASRYAAPLTEDFLAGGERAIQGFAYAVERAGPAVDALGEIGRRTGDLLADTFEGLADNSAAGGSALLRLWGIFEFGIRSIAGTIEGLTVAYGWMEKFAAFVTGDVSKLAELVAAQEAAKASGDGLSTGLQELMAGFQGTGDKAAGATTQVRSLQQILDDFANATLDARSANRDFQASIDDATAAVKRNGRTLDSGTEKGRANQAALDGIAQAALRNRDAVLASTGSQEKANAAAARGRSAFIRTAEAMGMSRSAAIRLADKLFAIPNISRTVTVQTKSAEAAIRRVQQGLGRVNSKDIRIGVYYKSNGDLKLPGGTQLKGLSGGGPVTGPGAKGVDSQLRVLAPGEHVLTAAEVDAAGGHAGVERLRSVLRGGRGAAGVASGVLSSPAVGAAATQQQVIYITVNVPAVANPAEVGREVVESIRAYERRSGAGWRS
ncbi:hypothetical protein [Micromonospora sp. WMMD998]|uniref:hypothetical protein n=1 Tax=Micromonospora sp. WMMD998 TaxID=3016092 RepID=UPI002499B2F1|nr:hypothetical protein [Micromonospora sp. WMMD998]WFE41958.1 hypothetical protein O7619_27320 [Micromonospora sp. WMMD998]